MNKVVSLNQFIYMYHISIDNVSIYHKLFANNTSQYAYENENLSITKVTLFIIKTDCILGVLILRVPYPMEAGLGAHQVLHPPGAPL